MGSVFWTAIAVIAVSSIVTRGVVEIIKASKAGGKGSKRFDDLEGDLANLEQDLEDARQRIEVLEKIVTDGKYDLSKQINDLGNL